MKTQPGYIATRLHQNIDPNGKYHLVNVARWRNMEDFKAATAKMRQALPDNMPEGVTASPGLFKVIETICRMVLADIMAKDSAVNLKYAASNRRPSETCLNEVSDGLLFFFLLLQAMVCLTIRASLLRE